MTNFDDLTAGRSYFNILNIPESYTVSPSLLESNYQDLIRSMHPDKFSASSEQEKKLSIEYCALINTAYKTLSDDLSRAIYWLKQKGIEMSVDDNSGLDQNFLFEQMALREQTEKIVKANDHVGASDMLADNACQKSVLIDAITQGFLTNTDESLQTVKASCKKLFFISKLGRELDEIIEFS